MRDFLKRNKGRLCYALAFGALLIGYYAYHKALVPISSDQTTTLPMAEDMLSGNLFLSGWVMGTNNFYFTSTVFLALLRLLGAPYFEALHLLPAAAWAGVVLLLYRLFLAETGEGRFSRAGGLLCFGALVAVVALTNPAAYTLLNINSHNGLYVFALVSAFFAFRFVRTGSKGALAAFTLLSALSYYSDSLALLTLYAPAGLVSLLSFFREKQNKKTYLWLGAAAVLSFLLGKLTGMAIEGLGGVVTQGLPLGMSWPGTWPGRAAGFYESLLALLGRTEGALFTLSSFAAHGLFLLCFFVMLYHTFRYARMSKKDQALYIVAVLNIAACLCTGIDVHLRYIVPAFLCALTLTLRTVWSLYNRAPSFPKKAARGGARALAAFCLALCLILGVCKLQGILSAPRLSARPEEELLAALTERGYDRGYGQFWSASLLSARSDFEKSIYPVSAEENGLALHPNLVRTDWAEETGMHFYVAELFYTDEFECFKALAGEPDAVWENGKYRVYFYEEDLSAYMAGDRGLER